MYNVYIHVLSVVELGQNVCVCARKIFFNTNLVNF